jgi:hypothetical protein
MSELLFSYGTLRQREVQLATFGRELDGYDLHYVTINECLGSRVHWLAAECVLV